jgi:hypothetical protein
MMLMTHSFWIAYARNRFDDKSPRKGKEEFPMGHAMPEWFLPAKLPLHRLEESEGQEEKPGQGSDSNRLSAAMVRYFVFSPRDSRGYSVV